MRRPRLLFLVAVFLGGNLSGGFGGTIRNIAPVPPSTVAVVPVPGERNVYYAAQRNRGRFDNGAILLLKGGRAQTVHPFRPSEGHPVALFVANRRVYGITVIGRNSGKGILFRLNGRSVTVLARFEGHEPLTLAVSGATAFGVAGRAGATSAAGVYRADLNGGTPVEFFAVDGLVRTAAMLDGVLYAGGTKVDFPSSGPVTTHPLYRIVAGAPQVVTADFGDILVAGNGRIFGFGSPGPHYRARVSEWEPASGTSELVTFTNPQVGSASDTGIFVTGGSPYVATGEAFWRILPTLKRIATLSDSGGLVTNAYGSRFFGVRGFNQRYAFVITP